MKTNDGHLAGGSNERDERGLTSGSYRVETRYGWGWRVVASGYESHPIDSAINAENLAGALNAGHTGSEALKLAGLVFNNGRLYGAAA